MKRPWIRPAVALAIVTSLLQTTVCFGEIKTDVDVFSQSETDVEFSSYTLFDAQKGRQKEEGW